MKHYSARQVADGPSAGKWHYTCGDTPAGWCSKWRSCPSCDGMGALTACDACAGRGVIEVDWCPGHDTATEAQEHYREYLLIERARLDMQDSAQRPCEVCGAWTQGLAEVGTHWSACLCDEHRTAEVLADIFPPVGESWSS